MRAWEMVSLTSRRSLMAAGVAVTLVGGPAQGADPVFESEHHRFKLITLTRGLEYPWGLAFLPDGGMLITERAGRLRRVSPTGELDDVPVSGVPPVVARGQGGLLDVARHPEFDRNALIYLTYSGAGRGGAGTEVARGRLGGGALTDVEVIFRASPKVSGGRHFGSRLLFAPDGMLLVTLGDRGDREQAQNTRNHLGSVVRIAADGSVPTNNPALGSSGSSPEIYTFGHRNVQGIAIDRATGRIFTEEHGPQGGDEINLLQAGVNYGWPVITYGVNYGSGTRIGEGSAKAAMAQPIHQWTPSIAPSGLAFYDGDKFPRWRGNLFAGALKFQLLSRLELEGDRVVREERLLEGEVGRVRDVRTGPDGFIYLLAGGSNGTLLRLEPADDE